MTKSNKPAKLNRPTVPEPSPPKLELVRVKSPEEVRAAAAAPPIEPAPPRSLKPKEEKRATEPASAYQLPPPSTRPLPISPVTESLQFRAIGLVLGRYVPDEDSITKGKIVTTDGSELDAVLLGKVISLVKNRLDRSKDRYWVVYPRTRSKEGELHVQVTGVWAPEDLNKPDQPTDPGVADGYFSIRGEVVSQSTEAGFVTVKIKRGVAKRIAEKPRRKPERPPEEALILQSEAAVESKPEKPVKRVQKGDRHGKFKLRLAGILPGNPVGAFWEVNAQRQGNVLRVIDGQFIATVPAKYRSKGQDGRFSARPQRRSEDDRPRPRLPGDLSAEGLGSERPRPPKPKPKGLS
ncbi:MAG: hypothetical protein HC918_02005 [Oscillatoriales cyanobacterium SM2_1_8]|nr:hypothetical protein [Oscillatoriales cyanobacterium SM2_1_8]